jgi:hypothetical protein
MFHTKPHAYFRWNFATLSTIAGRRTATQRWHFLPLVSDPSLRTERKVDLPRACVQSWITTGIICSYGCAATKSNSKTTRTCGTRRACRVLVSSYQSSFLAIFHRYNNLPIIPVQDTLFRSPGRQKPGEKRVLPSKASKNMFCLQRLRTRVISRLCQLQYTVSIIAPTTVFRVEKGTSLISAKNYLILEF